MYDTTCVIACFAAITDGPHRSTLVSIVDHELFIVLFPSLAACEYTAEEGIYLAIRRVFTDVPRMAKATAFVLQRKDEEWGEFVDMKKDETVRDRCVLKVVLETQQV